MPEHSGYITHAKKVPTTRRPWWTFHRHFGLPPTSKEKLLDIGSGWGSLPGLSNIVRLDYAYGHHTAKRIAKIKRPVSGLAQQLPIKSGTFDRVTMQLLNYHFDPVMMAASVAEGLRVLKQGGRYQVYPVWMNAYSMGAIRNLRDEGIVVSGRMDRLAGSISAASAALGIVATSVLAAEGSPIAWLTGAACTGMTGVAGWISYRLRTLTIQKNEALTPESIIRIAPQLGGLLAWRNVPDTPGPHANFLNTDEQT